MEKRKQIFLAGVNNQTGMITLQAANLTCLSSLGAIYTIEIKGRTDSGLSTACLWVPIEGYLNNDGNVDIFDLLCIVNYLGVKEGGTLWPLASRYDLANGDQKAIDVLDLTILIKNYWFEYSPHASI